MRKIDSMIIAAKCNWMMRKNNGDSQVVVALLLIVVAIALCIIFRDQVKTIITNVAGKVNNSVDNMAGNVTTP